MIRDRILGWIMTRAVLEAFKQLEAANVGLRLDALLDAQLKDRSEPLQKPLAQWLRQVAKQLEEE